MAELTPAEIKAFLHGQVDAWNRRDKAAFMALYRNASPNGLHIEYVGRPLRDPWQELEDMWENYVQHVNIEIAECLVNGNEAACHHLNHAPAAGRTTPTLEVYKFDGGTLSARYFTPPHAEAG